MKVVEVMEAQAYKSNKNNGTDKYCPNCAYCIPVEEFHKDSSRYDGLSRQCKYHANKRFRKASGSLLYKDRKAKAMRGYRKRNPEKSRARDILTQAVGRGKLTRPNVCSKCNVQCIPQGHHPDYSKPLEVIWLCVDCHTEVHNE
jgi:hypothetical protein